MKIYSIKQKLSSGLQARTKYIGKAPLCNLRHERGPKVRGYSLPLCYRCLGVVLGATLGGIILNTGLLPLPRGIFYAAIIGLPMALDGTTQSLKFQTSNNPRRITTGLLFGLALHIL